MKDKTHKGINRENKSAQQKKEKEDKTRVTVPKLKETKLNEALSRYGIETRKEQTKYKKNKII